MSLGELLVAVEQSALGNSVRDLGGWGYAFINLAHILGITILFGAILLLDLRLIGWKRHLPLDAILVTTLPLAKIGFFIAVVSGICLISANATEYIGNPFLLIKFLALVLALINAWYVRRLSVWLARGQAEPGGREKIHLARAGFVSLICWLTVISAGRLIAYW